MGREWPLTGRADELRFIVASLQADGPRGVVLAGAAGVGKSRLAREALVDAEGRGAATWWASATLSSSGLPLAAFPELVGTGAGDPSQVLSHAADKLVAATGPEGLVVGVDDAHLLDDLSALLVHQLVLRKVATVVVTVRTGERAPEAVTALWKDELLYRLEVQPLSESETAQLLEAVLGGTVDSRAAARMWALTRGNALFLRHLVVGELEAGRLGQVRGVWRWSGEPALSTGLVELVEARMGGLSEPVREVVEVLSLGEPLEAALLAHLTDPAEVEQAETAGLVSVERDERGLLARLAHPLYGEVQRARLGELRARRLRGVIARALAGPADGRPGDLLRRAVLALGSDLEPDTRLFTEAARAATRMADLRLAERLARAALAAGGGFEPHLVLAYALSWLSEGAAAELELDGLAGLARDDVERTQVAIPRAANLFWILRRPAAAEGVLKGVEAAVEDDDARRVLRSLQAAFDAWLGRPQLAVGAARDALASDRLPGQAVLLATWGLVAGLGVLGRADQLGDAVAPGYARFDADAVLRFGLSDLHIIGLRLAGYLDEAERVARERHREGSTAVGVTQTFGVALMAHVALARGRLQASIRGLAEARAGLAEAETGGWDFRCLLSLTQALAMSGRRGPARDALAELESDRHPSFVFLEPEVVLARAWVAAAEGAVSQAIAHAREAASIAVLRGQVAHEVMALHAVACFGDGSVAERLVDLAPQVDGPRAPAAAAHAVALAADSGDDLRAASLRLEQMGDLVAAADAAAQAAAAHARHGRRGTADVAAARARRLAEACGGARTPALVAAARPLPLTDREREIVTLAAHGLSNRQIADRLVVSIRTVEGHLYRAGAKLGTTNRADFAALLGGD